MMPWQEMQTELNYKKTSMENATLQTTWRLGHSIETGDSYMYIICGSYTIQEINSRCYTLEMNFVHQTTHHAFGDIWIIEATYSSNNSVKKNTIMFLDIHKMIIHPTSTWDHQLADSIQDTILHLAGYGKQSLAVGSHWGDIDTYFHEVPLAIDVIHEGQAVLTYTTTDMSQTVIEPGLPFPTYSKWYDPNYIMPKPRVLHEYLMLPSEN